MVFVHVRGLKAGEKYLPTDARAIRRRNRDRSSNTEKRRTRDNGRRTGIGQQGTNHAVFGGDTDRKPAGYDAAGGGCFAAG
jgi:hypothetical protein